MRKYPHAREDCATDGLCSVVNSLCSVLIGLVNESLVFGQCESKH